MESLFQSSNDASVREGVTDLIRTFDFSARAFASAEEFLNSDEIHSTCCLIAVVQMRGMTGLELHDRLVASGFAIPALLITGYPDERTRLRALKSGVAGYLIKPFSEDDFSTAFRSALSGTRPTATD